MIRRLMVIGAHPDDPDFETGGLVAKLRRENTGVAVMYVSMTNGNMGHQTLYGERIQAIRKAETERVAQLAGVQYHVFDHPDACLEATLENRLSLIRLIRQFAPDVITTHRKDDYHPDHRATVTLVCDSIFALTVPGVAPEAPAMRTMPALWFCQKQGREKKQVDLSDYSRQALHEMHFKQSESVFVGIDAFLADKAKMLQCHESQLFDWLIYINGGDRRPVTDEEKYQIARQRAYRQGKIIKLLNENDAAAFFGTEKAKAIECVEAFECFEYGGDNDEEFIAYLKQ